MRGDEYAMEIDGKRINRWKELERGMHDVGRFTKAYPNGEDALSLARIQVFTVLARPRL